MGFPSWRRGVVQTRSSTTFGEKEILDRMTPTITRHSRSCSSSRTWAKVAACFREEEKEMRRASGTCAPVALPRAGGATQSPGARRGGRGDRRPRHRGARGRGPAPGAARPALRGGEPSGANGIVGADVVARLRPTATPCSFIPPGSSSIRSSTRACPTIRRRTSPGHQLSSATAGFFAVHPSVPAEPAGVHRAGPQARCQA